MISDITGFGVGRFMRLLSAVLKENIVLGQNLAIPAIVDNSRCDFSQVRSTLR